MRTSFHWGISTPFLGYVRGLADGEVIAVDGATIAGELGTDIRFRILDGSGGVDGALVAARGAVRATGHGGMLVVEFADPAIVGDPTDPTTWQLTLRDPDAPDGRIAFADLTTSVQGRTVCSTTTLTAEGADWFFGQYRPGTAFAPLKFDRSLLPQPVAA